MKILKIVMIILIIAIFVVLFLLYQSGQRRRPTVIYQSSDLTLYDLGALPPYVETVPVCINDSNFTVGNLFIKNFFNQYNNSKTNSFICNKGNIKFVPNRDSDTCSEVYSVSNSEEIVGDVFPCSAALSSRKAFVFMNSSQELLRTLGGTYSTARSINNKSEIAGASELKPNEEMQHACLWRKSKVVDLGSLYADTYSLATSINDRSQIVGESGQKAFIWQDGKMKQLEGLHAQSSGANCINNSGYVVGQLSDENGHGRAYLWYKGSVTLLGASSGDNLPGDALCINDTNQIVGVVNSKGEAYSRAVLWQGKRMIDLNTLLPTSLKWHLSQANWINNKGNIIGTALINNEVNERHGFLIVPKHNY